MTTRVVVLLLPSLSIITKQANNTAVDINLQIFQSKWKLNIVSRKRSHQPKTEDRVAIRVLIVTKQANNALDYLQGCFKRSVILGKLYLAT